MDENEEAIARRLGRALAQVGVAAEITGAGVHWGVRVIPVESRSLVVHCFWYGSASAGITIGMNPANARARLAPRAAHRSGPEYLVRVEEGGRSIADGRTSAEGDVVAYVRAWLAGHDLDKLAKTVPFIGTKSRRMRDIASRLDPSLTWKLSGDPSYELWVYGANDRACRVAAGDGPAACAFFVGQAQVALAVAIDDVAAATASWLLARVPVGELGAAIGGLALERHAEVLEAEPARWHWLHLLDRVADPEDVLAPLRELVEALARSPVATQFYSFSSLMRLCFSASSHYPWVSEGLPSAVRTREGIYLVDDTPFDLKGAVAAIERALITSPLRPFFGSAPQIEAPQVADALARQGSALRVELYRHGPWHDVVVSRSLRRCTISGLRWVAFEGHDENLKELRAEYRTLDDAVFAIRRYLEEGASFDEVAADERVVRRAR